MKRKSKQSNMTDRNCRRNSIDLRPKGIPSDPKQPRHHKSIFTEMFIEGDEPTVKKPVGISRFTENPDPKGRAAHAHTLSVTAYTGYEKSMQPWNRKSSRSSSEKLEVSDLPPSTRRKKGIIEKWAEGVGLKTTSSAGVSLENSEDAGEVAVVVHDGKDRDANISEIEREEQYEGDDELSSEDVVSSGEEKSKLRFG